jgi:hypothetical protein
MDGRRAQLTDSTLRDIPRLRRSPAPADERGWFDRPLSRAWAVALGAGWPLTFLVTGVLEPAPVDPDAPAPLVVDLGSRVFLVALVVTVCAAMARHRLAAPAAVVAGGVLTAFTVACPTSGHHTYGLWWVAQLATAVAMLAISTASLSSRATTDSPARRL